MKGTLYYTVQPHGTDRYWITRMLDGVQATAAKRGWQAMAIPTTDIPRAHMLMIIGTTDAYLAEQTRLCEAHGGIPLLVNAHIPDALHGYTSVSFDLSHAVRDCIRQLSAQGCRRLLLVGINEASCADRMKRRVFVEECRALGCDAYVPMSPSGRLTDMVDAAVHDLSRASACGVLCANDTAAMLLLARLRAQQTACPPIIGMGNSHLGRRGTPALTSVDFDYYLLGCEAVAAYAYRMASADSHAFLQVLLPTKLVIRASSGTNSAPKDATIDSVVDTCVPYFDGQPTECLLRVESCLQQMSEVDCELMLGAADSYAALSERLFLSERTLKYRMKRILAYLGLDSKRTLAHVIHTLLS